ncbi:MAG: hypothetical protein KU37_11530 [Sulfuricurvum sp. PC08-66]|nr:MAG: hypothetical protein KU37_11530 [Sulfuricurvum sp. PC08-66]
MLTLEESLLHLAPSGDLTIYEVEELHKQLIAHLGQAQSIRISLDQTDKIDSAGFQLIVSLLKTASAQQKESFLGALSPSVANFLALYSYTWETSQGGVQ